MSGRGLLLAVGVALVAGAGCEAGHTAARSSPRPAGASTVAAQPSTAPPPTPAPSARPSNIAPDTPAPALVITDLTFTGTLTGRAQSTGQGTCGRLSGGFTVQLNVVVTGAPFIVGVQIFDYRGPGRYSIPPERLSVHSPGIGPGSRFLPAVSGRVDVFAGERSGAINATLNDIGGSGGGAVSGSWTCAST